jgi:membrane protein
MLYHEIVRDDVTIRAESLSYFTLFSILPIVAGLFLLVSFFSEWTPLQNDFQDLIRRVLQPFPQEHRDNLLAFILEYKNVYLQKTSQNGASLGFFAVFVLLFIIGKVFINLEDLMNRIWSAQENRRLPERIRNLVLAVVILPTALFTALSLPGLIERFGGKNLGVFIEKGLPVILLVSGLFFLFRYFPNVYVKPKNALRGALLSGILFILSNTFLRIYFHFGTQTAYGKAAVIPLVAFFIYVSWLIIITGAEWSYILQNEKYFTDETLALPNLVEAALLLRVIESSVKRHHEGKSPMNQANFEKTLDVSSRPLLGVLDFLVHQGIFLRSWGLPKTKADGVYSFAYDPEKIDLIKTVKDFLKVDHPDQNFDINQVIQMISKK